MDWKYGNTVSRADWPGFQGFWRESRGFIGSISNPQGRTVVFSVNSVAIEFEDLAGASVLGSLNNSIK